MIMIPVVGFAVWLGLLAFWVACGVWVEYGPKARKRRERPRLYVVQ